MSDRAGNTLLSARRFNPPDGTSIRFRDAVDQRDRDDLYRFRLGQRSSFDVQLSGVQKGARVLVEVLGLKGDRNPVLRRIGRVEFSRLKSPSIRNRLSLLTKGVAAGRAKLSLDTSLEPGEYYLRVAAVRSKSQYQLQITAKTDSTAPNFLPPVPEGNPSTGIPPAGQPPTGGTGDLGSGSPDGGSGNSGSGNSGSGSPGVGSGGTTNPPSNLTTTVLYSGVGLPQNQPWLTYGQLPLFGNSASQTIAPAGVTLSTQSGPPNATRGYAGYSNYTFNLATFAPQLVNNSFPALDSNRGFSLSFRLSVNAEQSNPNRSGFSVTLLNNSAQGIELGFKSNRIFAQSDTFTEAETVTPSFSLSSPIDYKLAVQGNGYQLFANNTQILNGQLRSYQFDPATSDPPLPFNAYRLPNFLFLGDNTDQGSTSVTLGNISIAA
ncbi:choice-of-anchor Y domain-containing protein [Leptolyngbya ohadii]|uniref:choice-of-anchor Y domain-containing protein n=1 Tax=Leptolyngbya ohadii TaxID=1962290 RepID=UPI000B59FA84|nr:hypothetical protein [Leptolyngbya ohadii]